MAWSGIARQVRRGLLGYGAALRGLVHYGTAGGDWRVPARSGKARQVRHGAVREGWTWWGRLGLARSGAVWYGRYGEAGSGKVRFSKAGMAWSGEVRCGSLQHGRQI